MATDPQSDPTRDATAVGTGRTVAHVDLGSAANGRAPVTDPVHLLQCALRRLEQTVRANDRICPLGLTRIAIAFGPDAGAATTKSLGERLARSLAFGLATDSSDSRARDGIERPGRNGQSLPRGTGHTAGNGQRAVVTVDRVFGGAPADGCESSTGGDEGSPSIAVGAPWLRHRTVVQYPSGPRSARGRLEPSSDSRHNGRAGSLLVFDPTPSVPGTPGLAAQAAVATSERLGFRAEALASVPDQPFDPGVLEQDLDLVILVVGSEPAGRLPQWSESSWCVPAQFTAGFGSLGVDVLTVSAGAGAGALIGCYEQGATILFHLDDLPAELHYRRRHLGTSRPRAGEIGRLPGRFEALLQLTASERRVLFYLTKGLSAQDIADVQVVSLTTVRSHIRSILRKLGVRSQLAAVVCANSRDLGRIQPLLGASDRRPLPSRAARTSSA